METEPSILIIDDETEFTSFMSSFLESRGYRVRVANNGKEGLQRIQEEEPDLLVLDIRMPKMGGIEFYTKICSPYGRTRFPVLVMTGMEELTDYFQDILVDGFMTKPVEIEVFLAKAEALLSNRSRPVVYFVNPAKVDPLRLEKHLTSERFHVMCLRDTNDFEDYLKKAPPRFVIVDIAQLEDGGEEFVRKIRSSQARKAPVIAFSGNNETLDATAFLKAGGDRFLGSLKDLKPLFFALRQLQKTSGDPVQH